MKIEIVGFTLALLHSNGGTIQPYPFRSDAPSANMIVYEAIEQCEEDANILNEYTDRKNVAQSNRARIICMPLIAEK